jgi:DNA-directed RNA polymerase subunit RPC12/RpoP
MDLICPACKKKLDITFAIDNLEDEPPQKGDVIFCRYCRMVSYVTNVAPPELRVMSDAEILLLPEHAKQDLDFASKIKYENYPGEN